MIGCHKRQTPPAGPCTTARPRGVDHTVRHTERPAPEGGRRRDLAGSQSDDRPAFPRSRSLDAPPSWRQGGRRGFKSLLPLHFSRGFVLELELAKDPVQAPAERCEKRCEGHPRSNGPSFSAPPSVQSAKIHRDAQPGPRARRRPRTRVGSSAPPNAHQDRSCASRGRRRVARPPWLPTPPRGERTAPQASEGTMG